MKNLKSHFAFNRSQQNGIFVLAGIILLLQLFYFFYPFSSEVAHDPEKVELAEELQQRVNSLKRAKTEAAATIQPFNPNFISDYKGYTLGMSVEEIDRLHEFRATGQWINSAEDFQKVTGISDSLLLRISPFFNFPDFVRNSGTELSKRTFSEPLPKEDLNTVTAEELQKINGIGEKLSARIVKYRETLGGFRGEIQLQEVYGLSAEVIQRVRERFEVRNFSEKTDLNVATVLQLTEIPYFNYELARKIVKLRERKGKISTFEELREISGFPDEKIEGIKLYLTID